MCHTILIAITSRYAISDTRVRTLFRVTGLDLLQEASNIWDRIFLLKTLASLRRFSRRSSRTRMNGRLNDRYKNRAHTRKGHSQVGKSSQENLRSFRHYKEMIAWGTGFFQWWWASCAIAGMRLSISAPSRPWTSAAGLPRLWIIWFSRLSPRASLYLNNSIFTVFALVVFSRRLLCLRRRSNSVAVFILWKCFVFVVKLCQVTFFDCWVQMSLGEAGQMPGVLRV